MRSGIGTFGDGPRAGLFDAINRALVGLERLGVDGLQPMDLTAYLRSVRSEIDRLEMLGAQAVAALERVSAYEQTGATDMVGFLANECRLTPEAANDRVVLARQLDQLSDTVAGVSNGTLSFDDAAVVARTTAKARPDHVPTVEAMILAKAGTLLPGRLRHHAQTVLAEVDSEALRRDATRARERRAIRIGPDIDGLATISGCLTSLAAADLRASLEPYMLPADRHDTRTAEQRRHDALHEICRRPRVGAGAVRRGRRPEVVVVTSVETLAGEDGPPPLLQGLIPISQEELDTILDDANITVAIKNMKGNLAYVGRSARSYSKPKRRAMLAVSPICVFEGCSRLAADSTGHHVVEFSQGGETTVDTQAPLCWAHQDRVHWDGWVVLPDGQGGFRTLAPKHPDNPRTGLSPQKYRRRRREAIFRRRQAKRRRSQLSGQPPSCPPGGS
jgi:hypothetical protein